MPKIDLPPIDLSVEIGDIEGFLAWCAVFLGFALALAALYELRRDRRDSPVEKLIHHGFDIEPRDRHFGGM